MMASCDLMFQKAVDMHQSGDLDGAEQIYRQLLEISPENGDLLHLIGLIACQRGAFDSALGFLYKAVRFCPNSYQFEFTLAQALNESGRPKEALEHYMLVEKLNPDFPDTYNNIGVIYRSLKDTENAKKYFEIALQKNPHFALVKVNQALILRDENDLNKAIELLNFALIDDEKEPEAWFQKGATLRMMGKYNEALTAMATAVDLSPQTEKYWNGIGIIYENLGQNNEALDAYNHAIAINPLYPDPFANKANIEVKNKDFFKAEDDFKHAVKLDPKFDSAFHNLGTLLMNMDRLEEALECFRKAFIINPNSAKTCFNLANIVRQSGEYGEAIGLYFNTLRLDPNLEEAHIMIAESLHQLYTIDADTAVKLTHKWKTWFPNNAIANHICNAFDKISPEESSPEYIKNLFDNFAENFEKTLSKLDYKVPELIKNHLPQKTNLKVLDAGCGTGWLAPILKPISNVLDGIDLSEKMIEKAKEKNAYSNLITTDIISYLSENKSTYDLVCLADVVCYYGQTASLFNSIFNSLTDEGSILFTIEKNSSDDDYLLDTTGRYKHNPNSILNLLKDIGFEKIENIETILRKENNKDVIGCLIKAQKKI